MNDLLSNPEFVKAMIAMAMGLAAVLMASAEYIRRLRRDKADLQRKLGAGENGQRTMDNGQREEA